MCLVLSEWSFITNKKIYYSTSISIISIFPLCLRNVLCMKISWKTRWDQTQKYFTKKVFLHMRKFKKARIQQKLHIYGLVLIIEQSCPPQKGSNSNKTKIKVRLDKKEIKYAGNKQQIDDTIQAGKVQYFIFYWGERFIKVDFLLDCTWHQRT